jgi:hypothetical protein
MEVISQHFYIQKSILETNLDEDMNVTSTYIISH